MVGELNTPTELSLPPGEIDPNVLYVAVGKAIHAWEGLEETLARVYAFLTGLPERPDALLDYGSENGIFKNRIAAIQIAATSFFIRRPNQALEAEMDAILLLATDLSIKRHRIAHGHITMWGSFELPQTHGEHEISAIMHFRWGSPWYSSSKLRANPVGVNAASIDDDRTLFEALHNRVAVFIGKLNS